MKWQEPKGDDELWLSAWYSVQALCKPSVDVQSQGRMRQPGERPFIEWDGVLLEAGTQAITPHSSSPTTRDPVFRSSSIPFRPTPTLQCAPRSL